jgi:3-oxoacyl-[acyl-carrier protein] reductase
LHNRNMVTTPVETPGGRVAIVAGGSRGIGRETIRRLTAGGYAVVVVYAHDQRTANSTVEAVLACGGAAVAVRADVTDDLDVQRLFAETVEAFGGVDVVVHAVHSQVGGTRLAEADLDDFDALCRTTVRATLIVNREAARQLRHGGAIVNLSSTVADSALTTHGVQAATAAALNTLTRAFAVELRNRDITVNAVSLELDKPCTPEKVAAVIAHLLSDDGHAITGQVINIDNG